MCGCERAEQELLDLAPTLSTDVAAHLVQDDEATFHRYARTVGFPILMKTKTDLWLGINNASREDCPLVIQALWPHLLRVSRQIAEIHHCADFLNEVRRLELKTPQLVHEYIQRDYDVWHCHKDASLSTEEKLRSFAEKLPWFRENECWQVLVDLKIEYFEALFSQGLLDEALPVLRDAHGLARTHGCAYLGAKCLKDLGVFFSRTGAEDSARVHWDRALAFARESRLPVLGGQVLSSRARHEASRGHFALAGDLFREGQDLCREFKGGFHELAILVESLVFFADLGCWEFVGGQLPRARELLEYPQARASTIRFLRAKLQVDQLEAGYLLSRGQVEPARALLWQAEEQGTAIMDKPFDGLAAHGIEGFLDQGRPELALQLLASWRDRVVSTCRWEQMARSSLLAARAEIMRDNLAAAEEALAAYASLAREHETADWAFHGDCENVSARLALRRGDQEGVVAALGDGLAWLATRLDQADASALTHILLERHEGLRWIAQDVFADLGAAYGFEIYWRDLPRLIGSEEPLLTPEELSQASTFVEPGREFQASLAAVGGVHLLYSVAPDRVLLWVVTVDSIRRHMLVITPAELRRAIARVFTLLSEDPGDLAAPLGSNLSHELARLAAVLLPESLLAKELPPGTVVFISPDDVLGLLPFATLNLAGGAGYDPLLRSYYVAYVRSARRGDAVPATERGLVIADPVHAEALQRRYPFLRALPGGREEAQAVSALLPRPTLLVGERASKADFKRLAPGQSYLYFTAHVVRDPERPFFPFLPLSADPDDSSGIPSVLDIKDIRTLDLRSCRLIVLSGCASGSPYVDGRLIAPSLGDAFLDAGCEAVIQTFWWIRDQDAVALMTRVMEAWDAGRVPPYQALSRVQQLLSGSEDKAVHPFHWGAFSVKVNLPVHGL